MKHLELFEGWLSGFSGKSKEPEDYSYQGSKFRDAKDMWDHPERYNKDVYKDYNAALQELEDEMGTREILHLAPRGLGPENIIIDQILRSVYYMGGSIGTSSLAGWNNEKDPCDQEKHLLRINSERDAYDSKRNWYEYYRFESYYFMNERFAFVKKGGEEFEHAYITKDCYHRWFETEDKIDRIYRETRAAKGYRFWKTDPAIIASRYTQCGIDALFKVASQMEKSQGEDFLIACDLDERIKKDTSISFSLFNRIKKLGYDRLLKSLQGEASDDTIDTISSLGEIGF